MEKEKNVKRNNRYDIPFTDREYEESSESDNSSDAALSVAVDYCVDCTCCV